MLDPMTMQRIRDLEDQLADQQKIIEELYARPFPHATQPNTIVTRTLVRPIDPDAIRDLSEEGR